MLWAPASRAWSITLTKSPFSDFSSAWMTTEPWGFSARSRSTLARTARTSTRRFWIQTSLTSAFYTVFGMRTPKMYPELDPPGSGIPALAKDKEAAGVEEGIGKLRVHLE